MMLPVNRGLITLATFAALGTTLAVADPTVSTNEAGATTGQPLRTAFYGEVSAWYGPEPSPQIRPNTARKIS